VANPNNQAAGIPIKVNPTAINRGSLSTPLIAQGASQSQPILNTHRIPSGTHLAISGTPSKQAL